MKWKAGSETTLRGYKFTYDGLSRLKNAVYGEGATLASNLNRFNEQVTGYDKQGNILGLSRYGQTSASGYGLIDNLVLSYDGNRLKAVKDNATSGVYGNGFEFKDGANADTEYTYDENGNLTKDLNKKITGIQLNCLDLPEKVQFEGGKSIAYTYAADGTKIRTTHTTGSNTVTTDYCDNAIYENGVLVKVLTEDGYITVKDAKPHYFIQDHQGNNRVIVDKDGKVEETNHYYPFGGIFTTSANVQPYKYNGKELDRANGLDWYDYGARQYDAAIGRWHVVDPMSEKYFSESQFIYCGNNPITFIDPDGKMKVIYNPDGTYQKTTNNNWFHNTFIGRQEYIDYGNKRVRLSEDEFWLWQRTGSYATIKQVDSFFSILEFTLNEPVKNPIEWMDNFLKSSAYSMINSPKIWMTGRTWSGSSVTPDEKAGGAIDVLTTWFPSSNLIKELKPLSWYKYKNENTHILIKNKKGVYNSEVNKYKEISRKPKTFQKIIDKINILLHITNTTTNEEK